MSPQKVHPNGRRASDWMQSKLTGAAVVLFCQGPGLSAPGLESHDRRCFRQTLCVVFFFVAALKSLVLACVVTILGQGGLGIPLWSASGSGCGHGGFQQMILCFSANLNCIVIFPSVCGWQVVFWFSSDKIPIKHPQVQFKYSSDHRTVLEGGREGEDFCCAFVIHSHFRSIVNKGSGCCYRPSVVKTN